MKQVSARKFMNQVSHISRKSQEKNKNIALYKPRFYLKELLLSDTAIIRFYFWNTNNEKFVRYLASLKGQIPADILNCLITNHGKKIYRAKIAQQADCCLKTVDRWLKLFVSLGLVQKIRNGTWSENIFLVHPLFFNIHVRKSLKHLFYSLNFYLDLEEKFLTDINRSQLLKRGKKLDNKKLPNRFYKTVPPRTKRIVYFNINSLSSNRKMENSDFRHDRKIKIETEEKNTRKGKNIMLLSRYWLLTPNEIEYLYTFSSICIGKLYSLMDYHYQSKTKLTPTTFMFMVYSLQKFEQEEINYKSSLCREKVEKKENIPPQKKEKIYTAQEIEQIKKAARYLGNITDIEKILTQ